MPKEKQEAKTRQPRKKKEKCLAIINPVSEAEQKGLTQADTPFTVKQILTIAQRTPKEHIYHRPAKGGGEWEYVTGTYVKKVLNSVFGFMWDFTIVDKGREGDVVWVQGRLTVKDNKGNTITKEQFGRAEIKFVNTYEPVLDKDGKPVMNKWGKPDSKKVKTDIPLDYGNDLKAAATDALKKCASEFGIANDVYGKAEFKELDLPNPEPNDEIEQKKNFEIASKMISSCKTEELLMEIGLRISESKAYTKESKDKLNKLIKEKANEIQNKNQMQ